jgi:hypothetical protein
VKNNGSIDAGIFDIEKVINYIFKEVELNPKNRIELDKLDYWFITGDWERS